ncbi:hypothetical protein ACFX2I_005697 [Malus domestica]
MEEWEIDLAKLDIRHVIAHGTYGTVYRGAYDGQDVAGFVCMPKFSMFETLKHSLVVNGFHQKWNGIEKFYSLLSWWTPRRKCDVYSFGFCLWEIYCCDMPYPNLSFADVSSAVVRQNLRPEIPRCCPSTMASVMRKCWDANPDNLPEMEEVVKMLYAIDTSKGGGMIPEDQSTGCFCFSTPRGP